MTRIISGFQILYLFYLNSCKKNGKNWKKLGITGKKVEKFRFFFLQLHFFSFPHSKNSNIFNFLSPMHCQASLGPLNVIYDPTGASPKPLVTPKFHLNRAKKSQKFTY